jgi:hypothetical protein
MSVRVDGRELQRREEEREEEREVKREVLREEGVRMRYG